MLSSFILQIEKIIKPISIWEMIQHGVFQTLKTWKLSSVLFKTVSHACGHVIGYHFLSAAPAHNRRLDVGAVVAATTKSAWLGVFDLRYSRIGFPCLYE